MSLSTWPRHQCCPPGLACGLSGEEEHADKLLVENILQLKFALLILTIPTYKLLRYPLVREGVYAPVGPALLANTMQKVSNIVSLTALRLAFFIRYG